MIVTVRFVGGSKDGQVERWPIQPHVRVAVGAHPAVERGPGGFARLLESARLAHEFYDHVEVKNDQGFHEHWYVLAELKDKLFDENGCYLGG